MRLTIKVKVSKRVKVGHKLKRVHTTRTVTLGSVRFAIASGHKATLKVAFGRASVARVKRAGKLKAIATAKATDSSGDAKTTDTTVTVRRYVKARVRKHHNA